MDGICTLANDVVFDQTVALLNSLEANSASPLPVCIYPYDANTDKLAAEVARRANVILYDDQDSIDKWDHFVKSAWDLHPTAKEQWHEIGSHSYHRIGTHRRYCAFDAPFDRFLYMDADTLLISPVDTIFTQLENHACVVYDFQYKDPSHVYQVASEKLSQIFSRERIKSEIFCSGFYAAKQETFSAEQRAWLLDCLSQGDAEILYPMAPDQTLINYMMMRSKYSIYNFAHHLSPEERTGCCVTSSHFTSDNHLLYDRGNLLTYIHYIGLRSRLFTRVCAGENIDFPYRDIFLHYRFLHEPEKRPKFRDKPIPYNQSPNLAQRIFKKLGLTV